MPLDRKTIRRRRNLALLLTGTVMAAAGLAYAANWWLSGQYWVVTDNAFVTGNLIPVRADATGIVAQVLFEETQNVKKGDLLIRLDAQRAAAALGEAEGELGRAVRSVGALFATREQMCQKILSRAALLDKVRHDIIRYRQALPSGSVSKQVLQNAEDQKASLEADLREAKAGFLSAEARVGGTTRTQHPDIEVARNKFIDAYIEFSRQSIRAPVSGYIAKRKAQVGDRVRPGDQLLTIVPLDHLWVEANLWENRLKDVRPGQPAIVTVDLYGTTYTYHGTVEGLVPGTGSVFALLPPDNATGNFIHIVQRVPVRIALQEDEVLKNPLRPGLSTVTAIDVRDTGRSPNAALTETSSKEYETDIYSADLASANVRASE
ncbi:MAG TPA: HlyD family efflux transporter periplasmic adaptor subunit, partial [Methylocella sp.]|nr:HlyD family efflux transporter periplasmic adaptor subunit [Methylocella sp.]